MILMLKKSRNVATRRYHGIVGRRSRGRPEAFTGAEYDDSMRAPGRKACGERYLLSIKIGAAAVSSRELNKVGAHLDDGKKAE
jgi:hypothetical protein